MGGILIEQDILYTACIVFHFVQTIYTLRAMLTVEYWVLSLARVVDGFMATLSNFYRNNHELSTKNHVIEILKQINFTKLFP